MAYGMLIDQKKCVGCHACSVACKEAHGTPPGVRRSHVVKEIEGTYPNVTRNIVPMLCMHCENAPCVEVCPSGASQKREDGIVWIDKTKCIGCKSCMMACPYDARYYREDELGYFGEALNEYEAVMYPAMPKGTVDKCTFCHERIDAGASQPNACVMACPAGARVFGDLAEIKAQAEADGGYQLLAEEGTNPSVWYVPAKKNQ
ncbi:MAG: 4Fe-4S dicluster domain-containing protein [Eggerthellaceae bacterium]|nr:4Fe-4S dicluster domain-containing protein [Eggerthellaceae bacterium]